MRPLYLLQPGVMEEGEESLYPKRNRSHGYECATVRGKLRQQGLEQRPGLGVEAFAEEISDQRIAAPLRSIVEGYN